MLKRLCLGRVQNQNILDIAYFAPKWQIDEKTRMWDTFGFSPSAFEALSIHYREDNGTPLQYSCLENPMDGGAWWAAVHGVAEGRTRLSDFTCTFHFHAFCIEEGNGTHSSVLAWRIPGTGEPGGLPSMRSHRVGHDWSDLAAAVAAVYINLLKKVICLHLNAFLRTWF